MENDNKLTRWQRTKLRLLRWWLFTFRNDTLWKGDISGFRYVFRKYWLDVKSTAPNHWDLRLGVANNAYGLLLTSVQTLQKCESEKDVVGVENEKLFISSFTRTLYETSAYLPSDIKFAKGLARELDWAYNRLIRKAQAEATKVTKEENDVYEALLQAVVDESTLSRAERRRLNREQRKEMQKEAKRIANELTKDYE